MKKFYALPKNQAIATLAMAVSLTGACAKEPDSNTTTVAQQSANVNANNSAATAQAGNMYKDGTYTARGYYGTQNSSITVTLDLANDRITNTSVQTHATVPESLEYQRRFAEAVPAVVVGKPLAEVKVDKLAGSSGTPNGFNNAIAQIREQASSK